jgi:hypothetical protein
MRPRSLGSALLPIMFLLAAVGCGKQQPRAELVTTSTKDPSETRPPKDSQSQTPIPSDFLDQPSRENTDNGIIVDDTHLVGTMLFRGVQIPIYGTKSFFIRYPKSVPLSKEPVDLGQYEFYIPPVIFMEQETLEKNFKARQKEMVTIGAELSFDDLRNAAGAEVQSIYNSMKPAKVVMIPFDEITFYAEAKNKVLRKYGGDPRPQPLSYYSISVMGNEDELKEIALSSPIHAEYTISGFHVKENLLHLSCYQFVAMKYHHLLTGDAEWNLGTFDPTSSNGSCSPVKKDRWVTRTQVKVVADDFISKINMSCWIENRDKEQNLRKMEDKFVDTLLAHTTKIEAQIDNGKAMIEGKDITASLDPDLATVISASATQNELKKFESGGEYFGIKGHMNVADQKDFNWKVDGQGKFTIPKSIRLHQMNNAMYEKLFHINYRDASPTKTTIPKRVDALFYHKNATGPREWRVLSSVHGIRPTSAYISRATDDNKSRTEFHAQIVKQKHPNGNYVIHIDVRELRKGFFWMARTGSEDMRIIGDSIEVEDADVEMNAPIPDGDIKYAVNLPAKGIVEQCACYCDGPSDVRWQFLVKYKVKDKKGAWTNERPPPP